MDVLAWCSATVALQKSWGTCGEGRRAGRAEPTLTFLEQSLLEELSLDWEKLGIFSGS